mmetsp:Transcript_39660/g.127110  ORF Transcript_39660/g.127110 Transcript_39660/m.127110 type:complete len:257 (+) Transcript_39660:688-1458(+)
MREGTMQPWPPLVRCCRNCASLPSSRKRTGYWVRRCRPQRSKASTLCVGTRRGRASIGGRRAGRWRSGCRRRRRSARPRGARRRRRAPRPVPRARPRAGQSPQAPRGATRCRGGRGPRRGPRSRARPRCASGSERSWRSGWCAWTPSSGARPRRRRSPSPRRRADPPSAGAPRRSAGPPPSAAARLGRRPSLWRNWTPMRRSSKSCARSCAGRKRRGRLRRAACAASRAPIDCCSVAWAWASSVRERAPKWRHGDM